jgi:hypothetical protein
MGLASQPDQAVLWPRLSLEAPDAATAARLGRWLLTDQGETSSVCALAQSRLAGEAVPAVTMGDR